jgi:hypothetical protein
MSLRLPKRKWQEAFEKGSRKWKLVFGHIHVEGVPKRRLSRKPKVVFERMLEILEFYESGSSGVLKCREVVEESVKTVADELLRIRKALLAVPHAKAANHVL